LHHVYLITRFATDGNQRNIQLLNLDLPGTRLRMVAQRSGSRLSGEQFCLIPQWPKATSILRPIFPSLEKRLDAILFPRGSSALYRRPALRFLRRRIRSHFTAGDAVSIVSCLPPHDLVLIGLRLKRTFPELRWIIDWQDLWSPDEYYADKRSRAYPWIREIERNVAHNADLNVVTNERAAATLKKTTGINSDRVIAIPHAFVAEDFDDVPGSKQSTSQVLKLGFLGNLIKPPKVPGIVLLEALDGLVRDGSALNLTVIGDKELTVRANEFRQRFSWLYIVPRMPHANAIGMLKDFDALLLLLADLPNCQDIMHAKLPFYLASLRPIIAIVPEDSVCADIIRDCKAGWVISAFENQEGLSAFLKFITADQLSPDQNRIRQYGWKRIEPLWIHVLKGQ
jgi:hypothetical protein